MPKKLLSEGFTLIELLVVIAILGALASLAIFSIQPAQKQARDTQRKSDLKQYQTALEAYANQNGSLYPSRTAPSGVRASAVLCTDLGLTGCPEDPKYKTDATQVYLYQSDGNGGGPPSKGSMYILWTKLEFNNSGYFVVCSNGKNGILKTVSAAGGVCPLP